MSISSINASNPVGALARPDPSEFAQKMFARLDGDSDGKVTQDEFTTAMEKRFGASDAGGANRPDAAAVFQKMDSDGDGGIDVAEFKTALEAMRSSGPSDGAAQGAPRGAPPAGGPPPSGGPRGGSQSVSTAEEDAEQVFDAMDTDKDGKVSAEELLAALKKEAEEHAEQSGGADAAGTADFAKMLETIDTDGDGSVSKSELTTLFEQLREPPGAAQVGYRASGAPSYDRAVGDNLSTVV